jgi:cytochrome bd-type quinol oxidase subunit 2
VSAVAWIACSLWIAAAVASAARGARRGLGEGRGPRAAARLKSPTVYLFTAYLLVAALVTPRSAGESTSPLLWLAPVIPIAYALATLAAIGRERRGPLAAAGLGLIHGGAVLAAAAIVLSLVSPAFVPPFLR